MKKSIILVMCLLSFCLSCPVIAQDLNPYTYKNNLHQHKDEGLTTDNSDADTQDTDDFYNEMINEQYGSNLSPDFNNRENINPNESDYSYGSSEGG